MLTKSDFMKYVECPVYLWMTKHRPDLLPEDTPEKGRILEMGREVDDFSRKLFPGGVEVGGYNQEGWQNTQKITADGAKTLFQPTVVAGELTCRADILERDGDSWVINEVKMATKVKKEYPFDVAFQQICFETADMKVAGTNLIHINNQYVRKGEIDPKKLFISEDIADAVLEKTPETKRLIPLALEVLKNQEAPSEDFLALCPNPRTCEYLKVYLESVGQTPEPMEIEPSTDSTGIKEKLSELKYPLYFLDYETHSSAIPSFDGTRPYQNVPFQYSLIVMASPEAEPKYFEFLARKFANPVPELLIQLEQNLGPKGSVIVWNESFEKGCNEEMARMEPAYAKFLQNVNDRVFDLMLIFKFKNRLYVRSEFQKSASLKKVLPIVCPELSYESLVIREDGEASLSWLTLTDSKVPEPDKNKLAENMLEYCKRDTEAMVCILKKLWKEIKK
ncbi:MAG: hypothetical protein COV30_00615 [Candidatus Yanofskybacteria bacterium CG10_big_fil_rev_8_21_14_0_10_37_15]|uniref:DUF2779 domain-containing protein n=1 Tax=Candidatus Yanofskybacteria bacterium CG10_big_fil_rev_8_21_14_0_10_37_15 TaxID=1975097 RepID=A0A2H0R860_9BACT|nr:MAG: hypothetical protein COV30_00615 [Candidatus Yanofskybacteria bacterium CG10_big_fil_rev_8_21_14_0_10_37_15]